ncbi:MAG: HNH endonuclease [Chloroflexota bacterium]|nr:HNH endonuclease [Chloroflexota bacterium]
MGTQLAPGRWLPLAGEMPWRKKLEVSESTDYDVLLADGRRLAPKALFGVAASRALNLDVRPAHFKGGEGTPCFRAIRAAEFRIVPKAADGNVPVPPDERNWIEGEPMRGWHLRYERNPRAAKEKKRSFREAHSGRLECEQCGLAPSDSAVEVWGEACIEVHHTVPLAELGRRETSIDDLMCVCANCHRMLHHQL